MLGVEEYKTVATEPLPSGSYIAKMVFDVRRAQAGLRWHGDAVGRRQEDRRRPHRPHRADRVLSYAGMDVGRDNGLVVDRAYHDKAPYAFTGTVKKVTFDLKPAPIEVEMKLHEATQVSAMGSGAGA